MVTRRNVAIGLVMLGVGLMAASPPLPLRGLAGVGAVTPPRAAHDSLTEHGGKPHAPVEIDAVAAPGRASIDITFETTGNDVEVRVWGIAGVVVDSEAVPISGGSYVAGQVITIAVRFHASGPREGDLAVQVSGTFEGVQQSRVVAVDIAPRGPRARRRHPNVSLDHAGEWVHVLPARTRRR